jgi:putative PIN family toxin of toxin-antitoxin system
VVTGLLSDRGAAFQLLEAWRAGAFDLLYSDAIYVEYADVLPRPKFARYNLTPEIIAAFLTRLRRHGRRVKPRRRLPVDVRDPNDAMVLAAALGGRADYLVTRDQDLLALRDQPALADLRIVTVQEFLATLRQPPPDQ